MHYNLKLGFYESNEMKIIDIPPLPNELVRNWSSSYLRSELSFCNSLTERESAKFPAPQLPSRCESCRKHVFYTLHVYCALSFTLSWKSTGKLHFSHSEQIISAKWSEMEFWCGQKKEKKTKQNKTNTKTSPKRKEVWIALIMHVFFLKWPCPQVYCHWLWQRATQYICNSIAKKKKRRKIWATIKTTCVKKENFWPFKVIKRNESLKRKERDWVTLETHFVFWAKELSDSFWSILCGPPFFTAGVKMEINIVSIFLSHGKKKNQIHL